MFRPRIDGSLQTRIKWSKEGKGVYGPKIQDGKTRPELWPVKEMVKPKVEEVGIYSINITCWTFR